ncbi:MAG: PorT family protein [Bacteroidetes bacterium]|nr:PorT family protein [Bacteroidota bacterium]MBU1719865.1 PorT family protein [Bacteroidota bacterium]
MSDKEENIDLLFRQQLEGYTAPASEKAWSRISMLLMLRKISRLPYLLLLLLLLGGSITAGVLLFSPSTSSDTVAQNPTTKNFEYAYKNRVIEFGSKSTHNVIASEAKQSQRADIQEIASPCPLAKTALFEHLSQPVDIDENTEIAGFVASSANAETEVPDMAQPVFNEFQPIKGTPKKAVITPVDISGHETAAEEFEEEWNPMVSDVDLTDDPLFTLADADSVTISPLPVVDSSATQTNEQNALKDEKKYFSIGLSAGPSWCMQHFSPSSMFASHVDFRKQNESPLMKPVVNLDLRFGINSFFVQSGISKITYGEEAHFFSAPYSNTHHFTEIPLMAGVRFVAGKLTPEFALGVSFGFFNKGDASLMHQDFSSLDSIEFVNPFQPLSPETGLMNNSMVNLLCHAGVAFEINEILSIYIQVRGRYNSGDFYSTSYPVTMKYFCIEASGGISLMLE